MLADWRLLMHMRLQQLEVEVRYQRRVTELLLAHLASRPDALPPSLAELLKADDPAADTRIMTEVSAHLKAGHQPLALRLLREETAEIWDELHMLVGRWPTMSEADRRNWVRTRRLAKVLDRVAG